ncbi:MAG: T9SS type A sorting domain-containing protein [Deferribacteres bacterium]|nr:T9SS type A sorting domain-containing protein [Deferribacteres bacterium]
MHSKNSLCFTLLVAAFCLIIPSSHIKSQVLAEDSLALVSFYNSTNGSKWSNNTNWLSDQPVEKWYGVGTEGNRVTTLDLHDNNLQGQIPGDLFNLRNIRELWLQSNNLTGRIPDEIKNVIYLERFSVAYNNLEGGINSPFETLTNMKTFHLNNNNFEGYMYSTLSNYRKLESFLIQNNRFISIPLLAEITTLKEINVSSNKLGFHYLELNANHLLGHRDRYFPQDSVYYSTKTIIDEGRSSGIGGAVLYAGSSSHYQWMKDGVEIPGATENPYNIANASAADSGTYVCRMTNDIFTNMTLYSAPRLVWIKYPTTDQADSLAIIELYNSTKGNRWKNRSNWGSSQPIRYWHGITMDGPHVAEIKLSDNNLDGTLPTKIYNMRYLRNLELANNQIRGALSPEFAKMQRLKYLVLENNLLTGEIPPELGYAPFLVYLNISHNAIAGTIPANLWTPPFLTYVYLNDNQLEGIVPAVPLANKESFNKLFLQNNRISGLPDFSELPVFDYLSVENNRLAFEDLEPNFTIANLSYSPQDSIGSDTSFAIQAGDSLLFHAASRGKNSQFQWFSGGLSIPEAVDSTYLYIAPQFSDSTTITCEIRNTLFPDLTLHQRPATVMVSCSTLLQADSLALVSLYYATGGPDWLENSNWLNGSLATWYGVTLTNDRVTAIDLSANDLRGSLPEEITQLTELTKLRCNNNKLTGIPDFTSMGQLDSVEVQNNRLDFADLELNAALYSLEYSPQDSIGESQHISLELNQSAELAVSVSGSQNHYQWFHNSIAIPNAADSTYIITATDSTVAGAYSCQISNSLLPNLILNSRQGTIHVEIPLSVKEEAEITDFSLSQNYPNPFNPSTKIRFALPQATNVRLEIFNTAGQCVRKLVDKSYASGSYEIIWDARNDSGQTVANGVYFYVLRAGSFIATRKLTLMK